MRFIMEYNEGHPYPSTMNHNAVSVVSIEYDFGSKEIGNDWEELEVLECDKCHTQIVADFCNSHNNHSDYDDCSGEDNSGCDGGLMGSDGPMMNYIYPLPGLDLKEAYEAAKKIDGLNLCIIWLPMEEKCGMALTGCGMDFSWEICEAYMRLGYVPPYAFASGIDSEANPFTDTKKWVLAGCRESVDTVLVRAKMAMEHLDHVEKFYLERESKENG